MCGWLGKYDMTSIDPIVLCAFLEVKDLILVPVGRGFLITKFLIVKISFSADGKNKGQYHLYAICSQGKIQ